MKPTDAERTAGTAAEGADEVPADAARVEFDLVRPQPRPYAEPVVPRPLPQFRLSNTFAALRYPNFRLWFFGQMISLFGTWMQATAQGYLVFELTKSPAYLGYVGFFAGLPSWVFMLYAGVVADRVSRRVMLVVTQCVMMVLAAILAALTFAGIVEAWHVVVLALALGVANAFDAPARITFVQELVEPEDLTNAIALNGTMFNTATAIGPAVAGVTYAALGPAVCFTINAVSFLGVIGALLLMRLPPVVRRPRHHSTGDELRAGLRYVASHPTIRTIISLVGVASLFGMAFATLLPAWAVKVLGGDSTTNGLLQSGRGVGALVAALTIASLGRFRFKGRLMTVGSLVYPVLLLIYAQMRWLPLSILMLMGVGWGMVSMFNLANALVQTQAPEELRGRVMSVYTLTFFGIMPLGALLHGAVAQQIGEPATLVIGGLIALAYSIFVFWRMPQVRALA
jgi:MFS family permease